jgi:hypothetical protein
MQEYHLLHELDRLNQNFGKYGLLNRSTNSLDEQRLLTSQPTLTILIKRISIKMLKLRVTIN